MTTECVRGVSKLGESRAYSHAISRSVNLGWLYCKITMHCQLSRVCEFQMQRRCWEDRGLEVASLWPT